VRALLDVNVLIGLLDRNHTHHATASDCFVSHIGHGWASCPPMRRLRTHRFPARTSERPGSCRRGHAAWGSRRCSMAPVVSRRREPARRQRGGPVQVAGGIRGRWPTSVSWPSLRRTGHDCSRSTGPCPRPLFGGRAKSIRPWP